MNKINPLLAALLFCACSCINSYANKIDQESLDKIVAVVNDDVVTKSELDRSLALLKTQIIQSGAELPKETILQNQALDQIIGKKLQLQVAKQVSIMTTDAEVDKTIANIAKQNHVSSKELYQRVNQEGMTIADYRDEIREQMTLHKLQQQEIINRSNIKPTQQEITLFLQSDIWKKNGPKEYHLEDILIPLTETASTTEIITTRKYAQTLLMKLNQGQDLTTSTKTIRTNQPTIQNQDLGWRPIAEVPSAFADQVLRMHAKEYAGPVRTSNGLHIIYLAETRTMGSEQIIPSRKQAEEILMQRKFEEAIQTWISKLRGQAFIVTNPAS